MTQQTQGVLEGFEMPSGVVVDNVETEPDLDSYDHILVMTSGGKDCLASFLHLLELGVPKERIEMHHHRVDGAVEADELMDWPVTDSYVKALAKAFDVPITFSWKEGGFLREMLRENAPTAPITVQLRDGSFITSGGDGPLGTRLKFPQVTADLSRRWCSGYTKISASDRLLIKDPRFANSRTLVVTGERAEESAGRARYARFEPNRADARKGKLRRHVDHWRPVHQWSERDVWDIIKRYRVNPHPSYRTGFSRASCLGCVFGNNDQWATVAAIAPVHFRRISDFEKRFGVTIQRDRSVEEMAAKGRVYPSEPGWVEIAMSREYTAPIFVDEWTLPVGAFGRSCGPT